MSFKYDPPYKHQEAYRLMLYKCGGCGHINQAWNSRDGVTPFAMGCSRADCHGLSTHVMGRDEPRTKRLPTEATLVFVSVTKEDARHLAAARVREVTKSGWKVDPETEAGLADTYFGDGNQPMAVTVEDYLKRTTTRPATHNGEHGAGELCQSCGRTYHAIYWAPDHVWDHIKPSPEGDGGLLCVECAHSRAKEAGFVLRFSGSEKWWGEGELQNCPRCGSDCTHCDSSRELQVSEINCGDCGFSLQAEVDEDTITEMWNLIRTESCSDYEEYADARAELVQMDRPNPPAQETDKC
ncbi:hypothetical protein ACJO2E_08765 [Marinobacter sp. M1N3S26]|uniref:hypothetical protein n=1 Tax=Marinobacter sp. M1N3S26 TaxID=3382299 RepID=UPI00387B4ACA